jgi:hypothetical protein
MMDWMDLHCHSLPSDEASRATSCLDYGTSRDLEIQPVPDIRKRNITLDHFDYGIGRDQPCEWVASGILVHQDYPALLLRNELSTQMGIISESQYRWLRLRDLALPVRFEP